MGISLHRCPVGQPGLCLFTREDIERQMNESSGIRASLWGEPRGRAPLLGTPEYMPSKALEMGACFHRGPILGNMGGCSFPRTFERRVKFLFLLGQLLLRNSRVSRKKVLETGNSLHRGRRWGTWRGFVYWDFLRDGWRRAMSDKPEFRNQVQGAHEAPFPGPAREFICSRMYHGCWTVWNSTTFTEWLR